MDCTVHGILHARILGWVDFPFCWGSSNPGIKPRSPTLQAVSLPAKPPGKPKKTGVGSLSLLQEIFPTQGSNPGLLHCRWILYQLSHQGSPRILAWLAYPFSSGSSVISTLPFSFVPTTVPPLFYLNCTLEFSVKHKTHRLMKLNRRLSKLIFHYILTCAWNEISNMFSFPKVIRK